MDPAAHQRRDGGRDRGIVFAAGRPQLGPVARSVAGDALPSHVSPVQLARLVGLGHRRPGRYGRSPDGPPLLGSGSHVADLHRCAAAVRERCGWRRGRRSGRSAFEARGEGAADALRGLCGGGEAGRHSRAGNPIPVSIQERRGIDDRRGRAGVAVAAHSRGSDLRTGAPRVRGSTSAAGTARQRSEPADARECDVGPRPHRRAGVATAAHRSVARSASVGAHERRRRHR